MPNYRWKQILERYTNHQEIIDLYNSKQMKELAEMWQCSVDCVRTIRDKLGLQKKNISQIELLQKYTKEQLENLYLNKYDRHLKSMAEGLNIYQDTLSQVFSTLNIVQQPHHPSEYSEVRKVLSEKAKERAKINNPIENIIQDPNWRKKSDVARVLSGMSRQPHKENRKISDIDKDLLIKEVKFQGVLQAAIYFDISQSTLREWCWKNNIELSNGARPARTQTEEYKKEARYKGVQGLLKAKRQDTDIEILLQNEFLNRHINFKLRKRLLKRTVPDIFVKPNLAIYADGCYFHACPVHCSTSKIGLKRVPVDLTINTELTSKGYKVFRIWGHDVKNPTKLKEFVDQIEAHINEQKI